MGALDGKVALVTGAARGQGRAHALALAGEGATVAVSDIGTSIPSVPYPLGTEAELEETARLVRAEGVPALAVLADIRDSEQVDHAFQQVVHTYGRLDILVANAALCHGVGIGDMTNDAWRDVLDTNLTGTFWCLRAALPHMLGQGYGRVVAIASGAGRSAIPNMAHYTASKWGVIGLVKTFALETAGTGITANVVSPSNVHTPMVANDHNLRLFCPDIPNPKVEDMLPRLAAMNPLGIPWLEPEIVSRAVLYLVNDPGFTTGTVLEVNLGSSANRP
jgi:SDR family mycofactocin-dependent oxidoreductase